LDLSTRLLDPSRRDASDEDGGAVAPPSPDEKKLTSITTG
jgi:hypothetical protein